MRKYNSLTGKMAFNIHKLRHNLVNNETCSHVLAMICWDAPQNAEQQKNEPARVLFMMQFHLRKNK